MSGKEIPGKRTAEVLQRGTQFCGLGLLSAKGLLVGVRLLPGNLGARATEMVTVLFLLSLATGAVCLAVRMNRRENLIPTGLSGAPVSAAVGNASGLSTAIEDACEQRRIDQALKETTATLAVVNDVLNSFLESGDWNVASTRLLAHALQQTESPSGFLAVALDGPNLRVLAHEGAIWDEQENRQLYEAKMRQKTARGFFDLAHGGNVFGEIIGKGKTVIAQEVSADSGSRRLPTGHLKIHAFMGVPILKEGTVVGVIAVANRPGGYPEDRSLSLETIAQASGVLYDSYRQSLKRTQLEDQQSQLEGNFRHSQKMEVLGELSGGIAHDFNNMLMVLSGSTELLEKTLPPHSPSTRYVEQIKRTIERATTTTKQLLAFSRKQVLNITPIDLHEVLTDSELMLPRLLGSDVRLTFQHQAGHSWIQADAAQLEQVIANLAINARDAMPAGGSLTISTRNTFSLPAGVTTNGHGHRPSGWVVLEVSDTGCGMDEETQAHIFEPFFTTKPEGRGTGLGLPTVYGIVNQFGGTITLDSRVGAGTRFQIYFPMPDLAEQMQVGSLARQANDSTKPLTILLADDEPSLRAAIAEYLRGAGHRVLESQSAHDALELARCEAGAIDVLLTDVVMPGLRGTELAHEVQELRPDVHVIYISGYAKNLAAAQVPRGAAFLQKPFRLVSLAEQLKLVPRKD